MLEDAVFRDFMNETFLRFRAYCKSKKQKPEDIDSIINDAFFRLWQNREMRLQNSTESNIKWLYLTINYIILEYAHDRNKHYAETISQYTETLKTSVDMDDHLICEELIETIRKNLNDNEYALFECVFLNGQDNKEIAKALGIEIETLWKRESRLKHKLAVIIKEFENF